MLHRIRLTVVDGECWLMKPQREYCPLNITREGRSRNLVQCPAHNVISQASAWRALVFTSMMVFYFVGNRFARWSSWPSPISKILFFLRGNVRVVISLCMHNFLFNWSISSYRSLLLFAWEIWIPPRGWLLSVCVVCTLPSQSPLCLRLTNGSPCWDPKESAWCGPDLTIVKRCTHYCTSSSHKRSQL